MVFVEFSEPKCRILFHLSHLFVTKGAAVFWERKYVKLRWMINTTSVKQKYTDHVAHTQYKTWKQQTWSNS